jgi:predicted ATP-dependent serine protease
VVIPEAPSHKLEVLAAREILELPDPPGEDELLGALVVRRQRVVIGAHTGHGKTTAALQMVRAVVRGEDFLGWEGAGGRALVVDAEQGLKTVKRRLREAGLHGDDVDVVRCPDGLMLDRSAEDRAALEAVIATGYDVVLADPHYKLHGGDSNAERETVELMRILDGWRETYGFALVLGGWRLRRVAGPRRLDGTFLPELVPEMDSEPDRQQPALHDHDRRRDMD